MGTRSSAGPPSGVAARSYPTVYLLDSSALTKLAAEIQANRIGPVSRFLASRRRVFASVVCLVEFLEGTDDEKEGMRFLADLGFNTLTLGYGIARQCASIQRRMVDAGLRLGENDAWIAATALDSGLEVVGDDAAFARVPGLRYRRV